MSRLSARLAVALLGACALAAVVYGGIRWQVRSSATDTIQRAEAALRARDYPHVQQQLRSLLWFEPNHPRALLLAGVSLNAQRRFPESIALLERIRETTPEFEDGGIALASSLISDGQLERAEKPLRRVVQRFPSRDALDRLVRLYLQELRQRDAIAQLEQRWREMPHDLSVLPDLLELSVMEVAPQGRIEVLESADERHPGQHPVVLGLAEGYRRMGKMERAEECYNAALRLKPSDAQTRVLAAEFALDRGHVERAQSLLAEISVPADDDRYWLLKARLAEQSREMETALKHLERAIALRPQEERSILLQSAMLRRLMRPAEAAKAAERAVELAEHHKQLMALSNRLDRGAPDAATCQTIAAHFEAMGQSREAAGWRQIADRAAELQGQSKTPPGSTETSSP